MTYMYIFLTTCFFTLVDFFADYVSCADSLASVLQFSLERGGKTPYAFPISVMLKEVRTGGGGLILPKKRTHDSYGASPPLLNR